MLKARVSISKPDDRFETPKCKTACGWKRATAFRAATLAVAHTTGMIAVATSTPGVTGGLLQREGHRGRGVIGNAGKWAEARYKHANGLVG